MKYCVATFKNYALEECLMMEGNFMTMEVKLGSLTAWFHDKQKQKTL